MTCDPLGATRTQPTVVARPDAAAEICARLSGPRDIVGLDGVTQSGKTHLLREVCMALKGAVAVDLDDFLTPDQGQFAEAIRGGELSAVVIAARGPIVVAGVCLLEVLERIGVRPHLHVYVKRMSRMGWGWADDDLAREWRTDDLVDSELDAEIRAYHVRYLPHLRADLIVERVAED